MTLPIFSPTDDPGPSFAALMGRLDPSQPLVAVDHDLDIRHGTTIAALRYAEGVVMAGDRRATEGVSIAHRGIEKVFPADHFSAVAIAGAAGPAIEMVRLFQTQLEHYEKVEGAVLSLEGKANQLSQMIRGHLPLAMQGLAVVPLFCGWDVARSVGRIFTYDVTGGRYEENEYSATGSGGRDARTTIKLGYRDGMTRDEAVELAVTALYQAADEDAATGGPDPIRGIYPIIATVDVSGYTQVGEEEIAQRFAAVLDRTRQVGRHKPMTMPFYVAPEQVMKDRAEYAQKGIARGRSLIAAVFANGEGIVMVAENPSRTLHKISEIYDRVAFAGVGKYNEFDQLRVAGIRHADTKGFAYSREDVDARSLANLYAQHLGQVFTHEMKPLEVEILVAELGSEPSGSRLYHIAYDGTVADEERFTVLGGEAETISARVGASFDQGWSLAQALRASVDALAGPERTLDPADLEVGVLSGGNGRRAFHRIDSGTAISSRSLADLLNQHRSASGSSSTASGSSGVDLVVPSRISLRDRPEESSVLCRSRRRALGRPDPGSGYGPWPLGSRHTRSSM